MTHSPAATHALEQIRGYYATVDASTSLKDRAFHADPQAVARIAALFAQDAVYAREGLLLHGRETIAHFFAAERALCGTHTLHAMEASHAEDAVEVRVRGVFQGIHAVTPPLDSGPRPILQQKPVTLDFEDIWRLREGKVVERRSSIAPRVAASRQEYRVERY